MWKRLSEKWVPGLVLCVALLLSAAVANAQEVVVAPATRWSSAYPSV